MFRVFYHTQSFKVVTAFVLTDLPTPSKTCHLKNVTKQTLENVKTDKNFEYKRASSTYDKFSSGKTFG
jgi:hypothetical protein